MASTQIRGGTVSTYRIFNQRLATALAGTKKGSGTSRSEQRADEALFSIERRVLVVLVNKHKAIIKRKFPTINMKDVVDSVEIRFRAAIEIEVRKRPKALEWENSRRTLVYGKDVRAIQEMATAVRNTIRNNAIKSIALSRQEAHQQDAIMNSVIIGGIDPRLESEGGNVQQDQLEVDIVRGIFKFKKGTGQDLARRAKREHQGFDVGHTFGPLNKNIQSFSGSKGKITAITSLFYAKEQLQLIEYREEARRIDTKLILQTKLFRQSERNQANITFLIAESTGANQLEGGKLSAVTQKFKKLIKSVKADLVTVYNFSPTILDMYKEGIKELFHKGKIQRSKYYKNKKYRASAKGKKEIPVYGPAMGSRKDRPPGGEANVQSTNIRLIIDLINKKLHDKIQKNMGKGRSKKVLNYRTGRFAKSAKLQKLLPSWEKNALDAQVKYMRQPYGVFEKGSSSRMAIIGRSPARIFGISIRQILQEERIVKLRRVKVTLRG